MNNRRDFIRQAGKVSLGFIGLETWLSLYYSACQVPGSREGLHLEEKYGPLRPDPLKVIDLPPGFNYRVLINAGERMDDDFLSPDKPDGMATFRGSTNDRVILLRNHELMPSDAGPFGSNNRLLKNIDPAKIYDAGSNEKVPQGGTTTLIYDEKKRDLVSSYLSLAGTLRNCAGGPTPWGTWVTCEEIVIQGESPYKKWHGYNFEVPASEKPFLADPLPLKAMGRFNHEAIAVQPSTSIVFQTEDRHDGCIYRFIPRVPGKLQQGGKLQALVIRDKPSLDTRNWISTGIQPGTKHAVTWIDLENVEAPDDDLRTRAVAAGAAIFARGEGMWYGQDEVFFACTNGGIEKQGQIFRYTPSPFEGSPEEDKEPGTLDLYLEPNNVHLLRNCDNLTIAPWGDVVFCEDNDSPRIIGVTPQGKMYILAHNVLHPSEFAGVVFSPSGKTLFVNIQHAGVTLAIYGPWDKPVT